MKICVCSDSHGNWQGLQEMIDRERPQQVLFLGDGERDWSRVDLPPATAFAAVCGNCDWMSLEPSSRLLELGGRRVLMTHGHLYGAKQGLFGLAEQARKQQAHLVLYGHTHRQSLRREGELICFCPGSMGVGERRYGLLFLREGEEPEFLLRQL